MPFLHDGRMPAPACTRALHALLACRHKAPFSFGDAAEWRAFARAAASNGAGRTRRGFGRRLAATAFEAAPRRRRRPTAAAGDEPGAVKCKRLGAAAPPMRGARAGGGGRPRLPAPCIGNGETARARCRGGGQQRERRHASWGARRRAFRRRLAGAVEARFGGTALCRWYGCSCKLEAQVLGCGPPAASEQTPRPRRGARSGAKEQGRRGGKCVEGQECFACSPLSRDSVGRRFKPTDCDQGVAPCGRRHPYAGTTAPARDDKGAHQAPLGLEKGAAGAPREASVAGKEGP
jgi:hypothetical protein